MLLCFTEASDFCYNTVVIRLYVPAVLNGTTAVVRNMKPCRLVEQRSGPRGAGVVAYSESHLIPLRSTPLTF